MVWYGMVCLYVFVVVAVADVPPSYPSSSKKGPKNWDLLEKQVEKEEDKPEGEQALV